MRTESFNFSNQSVHLAGTLYLPDSTPPYSCVIVLHAARGGERSYPFYQHLITQLPTNNIALLLYDRRGSGASTGSFETSDFDDMAGDALSAFDELRVRPEIDPTKILVYGISQGGWIAPVAAARQPNIAGIIIVSGSGVSPADQMDYASAYTLNEAGYSQETIAQVLALRARVNDYYRGKLTRAQLQSELARLENEPWFGSAYLPSAAQVEEDVTQSKWFHEMDFDPLAIWSRVHQPTLFLFGSHDRWVPIADSVNNFKNATTHIPDVTFRQIPDADHLMTTSPNENAAFISEPYIQTLLNWLRAHV